MPDVIKRAKIYPYKISKINPDKNFIIENLEDYLATINTNGLYAEIGYQRLELVKRFPFLSNQSVNFNFSKTGSISTWPKVWNYCKIVNDDDSFPQYYFVQYPKQLSQRSQEYILILDTLNTFKSYLEFDKKTHVLREHKDRLKKFTLQKNYEIDDLLTNPYYIDIDNSLKGFALVNYTVTDLVVTGAHYSSYLITKAENSGTIYLSFVDFVYDIPNPTFSCKIKINFVKNNLAIRKIDTYPEGLNPKMFGYKEFNLIDSIEEPTYLMYRQNYSGEEIQDPLNTFVLFEESHPTKKPTADFVINRTSFTQGKYYYCLEVKEFQKLSKIEYNFYAKGDVEATGNNFEAYNGTLNHRCAVLYNDGTNLNCYYINYIGWTAPLVPTVKEQVNNLASIKIPEGTSITFLKSDLKYDNKLEDVFNANSEYVTFNNSSTTDATIKGIRELDRTDQAINKIIKLPYSPADFSFDNDGNLVYFDKWTFNESYDLLQYTQGQSIQAFHRLIQFDNSDDNNPFNERFITIGSPAYTDLRNLSLESKVYNSEFYQCKFIYDSFSFLFCLEYMADLPLGDYTTFDVDYYVTSTINSKFMFKFPQYVTEGWDTQDYNNVLVISRNNEMTLYNSAYLNYIRTGYNYDQKVKSITAMQSITAGAIGTVANVASQNYVGAAMQIGNVITSQVKTEWAYQQKLDQARAQGTSVAGADDTDLLGAYTNDCCKLKFYKPSNLVLKSIHDLFYYNGYATNELKIPETKTRMWFNFIQCNPIWKWNDSISKLDGDILDDLTLKFQNGVTFLHCNEVAGVKTWDFDQEKENWERSLL